jgi:hypothetical protein
MNWNQATVYQALVKKGYYEKPGDKDKHVCISPEQARSKTSMIFHHPNAKYKPVHIRRESSTYSQALFDRISPCLKWCTKDNNGWDRYDVVDYERLANILGLG